VTKTSRRTGKNQSFRGISSSGAFLRAEQPGLNLLVFAGFMGSLFRTEAAFALGMEEKAMHKLAP